MADTLTVTGVVGPGTSVGPLVFTNVKEFRVDTVNNMLYVVRGDNTAPFEISITAATTFTVTKSGSDYTVEIS